MKVCECWHVRNWNHPNDYDRCYGTKECEPCDCYGDESKCNFYPEKRKAAKASKHPFYINCMNCGSNNVSVYGFDYGDIEIRCNYCGKSIECGSYHTMKGD